MGLSASKRIRKHLQASPQFSSACTSVYGDCLSAAQHAFAGVKPYQLCSAVERLHSALSRSLPFVSRWVPDPPDRDRVDRAFRSVISARRPGSTAALEEDIVLDEAELEELALQVFVGAAVSNVEKEASKRIALGAVGIGAVGAVVRPRNGGIVAAAIAACAVGIATDLYLRIEG